MFFFFAAYSLNKNNKLVYFCFYKCLFFLLPQALQFGILDGLIGENMTSTFCMPKHTLIDHSFEIASFIFFVAPMILITVLYCLIGITLRNASNVKESKLRLRKSLSNHKREVGQQRVLKMLGKSAFFPINILSVLISMQVLQITNRLLIPDQTSLCSSRETFPRWKLSLRQSNVYCSKTQ